MKEEEISAFAETYGKFKENLVGHPFRPPRKGSPYWKALEAALEMVNEVGGDPIEFLREEFKLYEYHSRGRKRKFYPAAKWLSLPSTKERYIAFLKRRRFQGPTYKVGGGWFTVAKTKRRYPIEQARTEVRHDPTAHLVYKFAIAGKKVKAKRRLWEACCYVAAKADYQDTRLPSIILNWIKENVKGVVQDVGDAKGSSV